MFTSNRVYPCAGMLAMLALAAGACGAPAETPPPAETPAAETSPSAGGPQVVTGRVPTNPSGIPTVVMLVPQTPQPAPTAPGRAMMDQISLTFIPGLLIVQTGRPVEFRNSEDVLHNVRVRNEETKEGTFNVALPTGGTYEHTFDREGFYDVGCDIHPGMSALIIAASTPYAVVADPSGSFTLSDVPAGTYTAVLYVGGARSERPVEVTTGRTELDLTGS